MPEPKYDQSHMVLQEIDYLRSQISNRSELRAFTLKNAKFPPRGLSCIESHFRPNVDGLRHDASGLQSRDNPGGRIRCMIMRHWEIAES